MTRESIFKRFPAVVCTIELNKELALLRSLKLVSMLKGIFEEEIHLLYTFCILFCIHLCICTYSCLVSDTANKKYSIWYLHKGLEITLIEIVTNGGGLTVLLGISHLNFFFLTFNLQSTE